jgi:transcription initiation factor TFIID TATA-box-binding protein
MVEVVNIVAGGDLDYELSLGALYTHFESIPKVETHYDPEASSALQLRFEKDGPLCMIYRTGKFVITGAESKSELLDTFDMLVSEFGEINKVNEKDVNLEIYNKVFTGDLDQDIDLSTFGIFVGLENIEYEPEQSPFLSYRSTSEKGVITLASTGKMVINGVRSKDEAEHLLEELKEKVQNFNSMED